MRDRAEELERASLSTWATLAAETKGRDRHEEPDPLRTVFHVDRDRILASPELRRLKDTAQVTLPGGVASSALMHTLHVSSEARRIGRALRLNEDLIEAIALAHDLGMPPFGAAGEEALSTFTSYPFRHGEQSVRILEHLADGGRGMNLTWEVRDGVLAHDAPDRQPSTPEGQVVRVADRIATQLHALLDAISTGLLTPGDIPDEVTAAIGLTPPEWWASTTSDVVVESLDRPDVRLGVRVEHALETLDEFLFQRVSNRPSARADRERKLHCLRSVAVYYLEAPELLADAQPGGEPPITQVCDFLCGLTDTAAVEEFRRRFLPSGS